MTAVVSAAEVDRYRAGLMDELRPVADPVAIQKAAARFLGGWLGVSRAFYGVVEEDGEHVVISDDYHRGVKSAAGRYRLQDFGPAVADSFRLGRTLAVEDIAADSSLTLDERAAFESIGVRAHATVFLQKGDRVVALFGVRDRLPRAWTEIEIAVLDETAQRTWAAVTHAQTEIALRRSEERLRLALDAASMGSFFWYPLEDRSESDVQMLELFGLGSEAELTLAEAMATFIHPDDRDRYANAVAAAIDPEGEGRLREEIRVLHQDGSERWLVVTARVEFEANPRRPVRMAGVAEDVSEWKASERLLVEAAARNAARATMSDSLRRLTDPRELQAETTRILGEHLGAQRVVYCEILPGTEYAVASGNYLDGVAELPAPIELEHFGATVVAALRAGETVVDADIVRSPELSSPERAAYAAIEVGAQVAVPLLKGGQFAALLAVQQASARAWTAEDVTLIEETAERTRVAVDRARAEAALRESEARERHKREQVELLDAITEHLEIIGGVRDRAEELLRQLVPRVADHASITLPGLEEPVEFGDSAPDETVPLDLGLVFPGILTVGFAKSSTAPAPDRAFLAQIAERSGLLLGSAHLREQEHQIAVRLQRALLPNHVLEHPDVTIAARYEPRSSSLEVGGDWYDSFVLPDGRIGLTVGDVVGHGIDAAADMGRLRTALSALAAGATSPGQLISHLDHFASSAGGVGFATVCYVILDPRSGELSYASAGHPPLLIREPDGCTRWLLEGRSPPLATMLKPNRPDAVDLLLPGAMLVLCSDGLIERRGEEIGDGLARLEAIVHALPRDLSVDAACAHVLAGMDVETDRRDDVVIMCLRFAASDRTAIDSPVGRFEQPLSTDSEAAAGSSPT